jgi:diguanylate cyclase (GGDEF)-like protein/putative nucleotidyltransferase with HDIG domain
LAASIRGDLVLGTACGLGLSGLAWAVALAPPPVEPVTAAALALAFAIGAARVRERHLGLDSAVYPVSLAALLALGPGASCLAGTACIVAERIPLGRRRSRAKMKIPAAAFRGCRAVIACALAAAAHRLAAGPTGAPVVEASAAALLPVGAHLLAFGVTHRVATYAWLRMHARRTAGRPSPAALLRGVPGLVAGAALGHAAAWALVRPEARTLLIAVALAFLAFAQLRFHRRWMRSIVRHGERIRRLHRSVTRGLIKTVESGDEATRHHLFRVRALCIELGEKLGLGGDGIDALAAAALFHDIGKAAVPDGILSKAGALTRPEMDQVKRHPAVGAEILQTFPSTRALAPIVRAHHERWDGRGYPDGLEGPAIPLAARILAVADCYDALTSDRPYRRALPHGAAMAFLRRESGRMFDPGIVQAVIDHLGDRPGTASADAASAFGVACEDEIAVDVDPARGHLPLAQLELQALYEISRAMSYGVTFDEYLTLVACRLSSLVPHASFVVYVLEPEQRMLRADFAMGLGSDKLRLMTIPLGERLSGWAAAQRRAVIGQSQLTPEGPAGSRSDLEEWEGDPQIGALKSTLVAPMTTDRGVVGVLTLYDRLERNFVPEERRVLVRVAGYVAQVAELRELRVDARQTSLTDPLTGVPNARFLWLECAHRATRSQADDRGFGLLGFRVHGLDQLSESMGNEVSDRALGQIARRFACCCENDETLVRFGPELFLVLTRSGPPGALVGRAFALARDVKSPPIDVGNGTRYEPQLTTAHATYPEDGDELESLLLALDTRLSLAESRGRTVLPFRRRQPGGRSESFPG